MSKINILDSSIYNLIAAGEVVERPLSIVKELVENSIDAGAKRISVELKDKLSRIIVADDGVGIEPNDMSRAFVAHATSKIATKDDLAKIGTLGFRGEALASIAAVGHITAVSRTVGNDLGAKIIIENGTVIEDGSVGSSFGTTITVKDIFKNLPARQKFLKKPTIEEGDIANLILRLILANPHLSIKLTTNGSVVYHSDGQGLRSAVGTAYGHQILDKMTEVHYEDNIITVDAFLGHPSFTKSNRGYGTIIVNGRYILSSQIEKAVLEAYAPFMMKYQFPVYVLHLRLPLELVDVNVHPNKTEVRFASGSELVGTIGTAVSENITSLSRTIVAENIQISEAKPTQVSQVATVKADKSKNDDYVVSKTTLPSFGARVATKQTPPQKISVRTQSLCDGSEVGFSLDISKPTSAVNIASETPQYELPIMKQNPYKVLCKLYNTYIVVESKGVVFLIDQHAAHERLIFDKFKAEYDAKKLAIQPLLAPYVFSLLPNQSARLIANIKALSLCGITVEEWGNNTFRVTEIPDVLAGCNIEKLVTELLDGKSGGNLVETQIISKACKAAVKGETDLKEVEITALLQSIDQNSPSLFCPHGRPIIVRWDKSEIDRRFKR